jgi:hypothetical protein
MAVTFKGDAKRLDDVDLPRVGAMIGVGEDEIHAVLDVEAAGSGFDSQGRVKALYEPHIAYRQSSGATRDKLVKAGLAYPNWKRDYPKDSYPRILAAAAIDETVALKATSWGLGQIMGFNCVAAGFNSPQAMVNAFADDEENHLDAMVQFIIANGLDDEIRRHDWAGFARGYNGPGYKANAYDTKLAAAFAKWRKIKDTQYPPAATTVISEGPIKVETLPTQPYPTPLDDIVAAPPEPQPVTQNPVAVEPLKPNVGEPITLPPPPPAPAQSLWARLSNVFKRS